MLKKQQKQQQKYSSCLIITDDLTPVLLLLVSTHSLSNFALLFCATPYPWNSYFFALLAINKIYLTTTLHGNLGLLSFHESNLSLGRNLHHSGDGLL